MTFYLLMTSIFQGSLTDLYCFLWSSPRYWGAGGSYYFVIIFTDEKILREPNNSPGRVLEVKERSRILTVVFWPHLCFSHQTRLIPESFESFSIVRTERGEFFASWFIKASSDLHVGEIRKYGLDGDRVNCILNFRWDVINDNINSYYFTVWQAY